MNVAGGITARSNATELLLLLLLLHLVKKIDPWLAECCPSYRNDALFTIADQTRYLVHVH